MITYLAITAATWGVAMALSPTEARFLTCFEKLRKRYPIEIAKAALETAILRQKAASKFQNAARMFFTKEALEQSSSEIVAQHRATRFRGSQHIADLCCGIGGDALALAKVATTLSAFELDPLVDHLAVHCFAQIRFEFRTNDGRIGIVKVAQWRAGHRALG